VVVLGCWVELADFYPYPNPLDNRPHQALFGKGIDILCKIKASTRLLKITSPVRISQ
jgi:hypothetical protein